MDFFLGKGAPITNVAAFSNWIKSRLSKYAEDVPAFQLIIEGIGHHKGPSTKTRAIVVICLINNLGTIRHLLDLVFHSHSNFPCTPFQVMYTLDAPTQTAVYKTHKSRIYGQDALEIVIPDFHDLDTPVNVRNKQTMLRNVCFDNLQDSNKK